MPEQLYRIIFDSRAISAPTPWEGLLRRIRAIRAAEGAGYTTSGRMSVRHD